MCGFLTEFTFNEYITTAKNSFENLLALSKQRGPDSSVIYSSSHYQLGFNRLAILDLSTRGNQPKLSPSKRYHVVFNGEIYNYKALEVTYELSGLQSTSDTEVLLHLLDAIGIDKTISLLNGMFAICIIDNVTQELYMIRDYAGMKPLFYGVSKEGIVAASQFNQVFKHSWFCDNLELRADIMKEYFGLGYMQAPNTIYQSIFQVPPGTYLKIKTTGEIASVVYKTFYKKQSRQFVETENTTITSIHAGLKAAVERHLISDVPIASFLSGGIDSPLITAVAKQLKPDIKGYTIAVNDTRFNELNEASAYAKYLKIEQGICTMDGKGIAAGINSMFDDFTEPFGDPSSIPTYWISQFAKQERTVMLSGDAGDELFWGYPRMLDVVSKSHWFKLPFVIRKPLVRLTNKLRWTSSWAPYHYSRLKDWVLAKQLHIFKPDLDLFFPNTTFSKDLEMLYTFNKLNSKSKILQELRYNEFYAHLQRILIKVDRMSMAHSLEVRMPFLDKEFIDLSWNVSPQLGTTHKELKYLLKKIMHEYYPKTLIYNKKKGFSIALDTLLRNELKDDVMKVVFDTSFYGATHLDLSKVKDYINGFYKKHHEGAWGVWHIYAWQKWALKEGLI